MNATVARITWRALLGGRRVLLLLALPVVLLGLAGALRLAGVADADVAVGVLDAFALGTLVPLLGLIAGTGVIAPEIDDGSVVYLLSKPLPRLTVVLSKLAVAVGCITLFAAVPTLLAGLLLAGAEEGLAVGFAVGALVGGVAYAAVFLLLGVVSRHAVVVGLLYALVWEGLVGGYVPGARTLSIRQWATSVAAALVDRDVTTAVSLGLAVTLLAVSAVAATWFAGRRLRSLTLAGED
jgi:ABC-2 type transport system permease protein